MIFGVYAIRDVKSDFLTPTIESNDYAAMRNFSHAVCSSDGILRSFAADYALYKLGTYDSISGRLDSLTAPEYLFSAVEALAKPGEVPSHV